MKITKPPQTEANNILLDAITNSQRLVKQGLRLIAQAEDLLVKAQQDTERVFMNHDEEKNTVDSKQMKRKCSSTLDIDITKEEIRDILTYFIFTHECRDSNIRNSILDKFEDKPYYEEFVEIYDEISLAYTKIGFDLHGLLIR